MQRLRRTLITISLALISLPASAGHEAAYEEARRQVQILHDLEDPAYRRANERWLQEHEKRTAEYQRQTDEMRAESERLRREGEERARLRKKEEEERARRIAAGEPDPDKVAAAWVWAVAAVLAAGVVVGSVWTRRRRGSTPTLTP